MIKILTPDFIPYMDGNLEFIKSHPEFFTAVEYEKFKRVTGYMKEHELTPEHIRAGRRDFFSFFNENDNRLGTNMLELFPEYTEFYKLCKQIYLTYDEPTE